MTNNHHSESLTALDYYYYKQEFYTRGCLLALKDIIMSIDTEIIAVRKYQIPFFCYKSFNLAFLWVHRKKILVGFVENKKIFQSQTLGRRKDRVVTIEVNPMEDIPVFPIKHNIKTLIDKYNNMRLLQNV
jgi:hypothetical protein